jgi:hypothetical protein
MQHSRKTASFALALVTVILLGAAAIAQQPLLVAIVRGKGDEMIVGRLVAELSALGFEVAELPDPSPATTPLAELADRARAVALLRPKGRSQIELWVRDPNTGETAFAEIVTESEQRGHDVVALRAVEVLRARLVRLGITTTSTEPPPPAPAPEPPPPAPPKAPEIVGPRPKLLWVDLGPAAEASAGGIGPQWMASAALRIEPHAKFSVAAFGLFPLVGSRLSGPEGRAEVSLTLFGASVGYHVLEPPWTLSLGPAVAVALVDLEAFETSAEYAGRDARIVTAAALGELAVTGTLSQSFRLRVAVGAGSSLGPATVRFAGRDVASWGQPFATFGVMLEAAVPGLED